MAGTRRRKRAKRVETPSCGQAGEAGAGRELKSRLLFCVVQVNRISLLSPSWRSWCYQGNEIISAAPSQPCQVQHLTLQESGDTKQDIGSRARGNIDTLSHRWLCSGRGCLLKDWSPLGRRLGPLSPRAAQAHLAARILWEEQSWEPESWRSQLAPSAPGTHRHQMSSCHHVITQFFTENTCC